MKNELNDAQNEAVNHIHGPLLVLAGAGTGKTRVLTQRIAKIIELQAAYPSQILAVTFTNKAAKEMSERVNHIALGKNINANGIWLGTFHSIAAKILRIHAEQIQLDENFTIVDFDDQIRIIKGISKELNLDEKQYPAKLMLALIQKWKDLALLPEKLSKSDLTSENEKIAFALYEKYQKRLKSLNAVDFGDLLLYNLQIFLQNFEILEHYQKKFKYILVDEYQDTNVAQYLWLKILSQGHKNICCVGDDDQSIYGWRGAEVGNILRFETDFPNAKIVKLEENYRSTNHILAAASCLIAKNQQRIGKTLYSKKGDGEKIVISAHHDEKDEARFVADEVAKLVAKGHELREMAILVRAGFQTRAFEECFLSRALPYRVIGGQKFYDRMEIRDVIAYVRATWNRNDVLAIERIINKPKRGIGAASIEKIKIFAENENVNFMDAAMKMVKIGEMKGKTAAAILAFNENLTNWHHNFVEMHHCQAVDLMLAESGYEQMWKDEKSMEADARIENLKELKMALQEFENIGEFLEHVSLVSEIEASESQNSDDFVSLMTLHAAKGLEFQTVFLPGFEQGVFPHQRSIEEGKIEEERRLAYVGMTRAKENLFISSARHRRIYNRWQDSEASIFLREIPEIYTQKPSFANVIYKDLGNKPLLHKTFKKEEKFAPGSKVASQKFGEGQVLSSDGDILEIFFFENGVKKIKASFVS